MLTMFEQELKCCQFVIYKIIFLIFAASNRVQFMIDLQLTDKTHDEARQGEALIIEAPKALHARKLYIESYGCQMNFADSEIVASILLDQGFETTGDYHEADAIF